MAKGMKHKSSGMRSASMSNLALSPSATLAERITRRSIGSAPQPSGRGHGRRGYGGRKRQTDQRSKKQDMLYFVRDIVRTLRKNPPHKPEHVQITTHEMANVFVNNVQYFDCTMIEEYVNSNFREAYPELDVPPHPDIILPADHVGLYFGGGIHDAEETLFILDGGSHDTWQDESTRGRIIKVTVVIIKDGNVLMRPIGAIINLDDLAMFELHEFHKGKDAEVKQSMDTALRFAAMALQTINQPRFVVPSKRDVSMVKRQAFRKATGRFTPDSWNLVSWNVDKPVKAKPYEEGGGGKQALHFRRGHWRKAKEQWERARWSEARNRWEIYVHGYEAGHPAFGVKKSYHMPRKEAS